MFVALSLAEFVVRKAHFRNYDGGPLDTPFECFFPADQNEMGRRANAYKGEMRRSLGRPERGAEPLRSPVPAIGTVMGPAAARSGSACRSRIRSPRSAA